MYKKYISIICLIASIILMGRPSGIAMTFAPGPTERITSYFSYFSLMPFGYGNWFPLITVVLSFAALFLLLIAIRKPNVGKSVQMCIIICLISSLLSWIVFDTFTIIGAYVAALHLLALIFEKQLSRE